ncbi:MAG TPA: ABC transporter ATP-binding protein [Mycobacteriales bacterium]|nr:ABC transporter ATP-binding protein [Mycobacteriales bacterium]
MSLLEVTDLRVTFPTEDGLVKAVQGISFTVDPGQTLGIVGESGSGKSVATQTIMGLTRGAEISGQALFEGRNLITMAENDLRKIRGAEIGMIFQDPLSSLHPQYKVGWQIVEAIQAHEETSDREARKRAIELLGLVGIPQPDRRVDDYPHQFSGGMRQRAMIAMALSLNPKLLIADEPTTALDVTVQAQIIDLIERLQAEFNTAVIMITHDLGVVADIADDVMVMYAGRPVEFADRRTLYYRPHMPYTKGLIESIPSAEGERGRLKPIQGQPPSLITLPSGCPFHPRCPFVMDQCLTEVPPLRDVAGSASHRSACWLPVDEVGLGAEVDAERARVARARRTTAAARSSVAVADSDVSGEAAALSAEAVATKARQARGAAAPGKAPAPAKRGAVAPAKRAAVAPAKRAAAAPKRAAAPIKRAAAPAKQAPAPAKRSAAPTRRNSKGTA